MKVDTDIRHSYSFKTTAILVAASVSVLVIAYNTTALINALPVLQRQFRINPSNLQWLLNSYILASVALMLLAGKLYDTFDKKNVFLFSICEYILASIFIAFAPNTLCLVIGRTFQGLGAAMLASGSLTIIKITFIDSKLQKAISMWSTIAGLGFCAGPFIGGFLTSHLSWEYIFWLAVVLLLIAGTLIKFFFYHDRHVLLKDESSSKKTSIDIPGIVFMVIGLLCVVLCLVRVNQFGWNNLLNIILFVVGIIALLIFYRIEKKAVSPIIDFSILKNKTIVFCLIGSLSLFSIILMEIPYLFNFYAQSDYILKYTPYAAGCALLPLNICYLIGSFLSSRFVKRFNYFKTIIISLGSQAVGIFLLSFFAYLTSYAYFIVPFAIIGFGAGLSFPCYSLLAINKSPKEKTGQTSGILNLITYFGDLSGITVWSLIFFTAGNILLVRNSFFKDFNFGKLNKVVIGDSNFINDMFMTVSGISRNDVLTVVRKAQIFAFSEAMFLSAVVIVVIMIYFIFSFRNKEL